MCQENLKIREEEELDNESMQNVLKQPLIIRKVMESLDFSTLLECRVVSKAWNKEATATLVLGKRCKISFKSIESVQEFVDFPPYTEVLFLHAVFNFEVEPEAKSQAMQNFLAHHAKRLSSIETAEGSVCGSDSVQDWTEKLLSLATKVDEPQPAILDENANYVQPIMCADESNLQEIVIHEEVELDENKVKELTSTPPEKRKAKSVHFSMVDNPEYVPIPYCDEGYETFADFYPYYLGEHSHATGRRMHILGITNSIILIIIGTFTLTPILYAVAIFQAYALAIGSHFYFDKHVPRPTIKNPVYMVMGNLKMWWEVASGQRAL